ncbi:dihydrolipoyl dehydrogenase family protein [Pedococcus sp. NPDC057267]|uniref:dihydrolipoyl dehydrogenase family protein n=1 Tax=Pedococcus sp. NPDC057267 TaxID=3346077 RepID=UPI0036401FA8
MNPPDLLVIGGGTAGIVAAKTAARLGADVLLVERDEPGGDCLWTGCVPSKALLAAADAAATVRDANRFGVAATVTGVDFTSVMGRVRHAIAQISPTDSPDALRAAGVEVRKGTARFTGPTTVDVDGDQLRFSRAVIATGATPAVPNVPGLTDAAPLTSDTIWALTELPTRLAILGGGGIGCELGQAFARLGAEVTIVEGADRLLPREDPRAADVVAAALAADGVKVVTGSTVTQVSGTGGGGGALHMGDGSRVEFDQLLVAVGRHPNTASLALPAAGVQTDGRGFITVDARLRTSNARVWAAGDLTGHPQFTHVAGVHGSVAASNAVLGLRRKVSMTAVPRVTFTTPEVAAVGVGTGSPPRGLQVLHWGNEHVDRAVTEGATDGFTRVVTDHRGRILGATVVGPRAGEVLAELTLAVTRGLRARDLAGVTHPYPTYGDGPWNAAIGDVQARLTRPPAAAVIGVLRRWRR